MADWPAALLPVAERFQVKGRLDEAAPYGNGHINDTYLGYWRAGKERVGVVLQRINHHVFRDPQAVMSNIIQVTEHIARKAVAASGRDWRRRVLQLVPATDGQMSVQDSEGYTWRAYHYIDDTVSYDVVQNPAQAHQVAYAFGLFQRWLADLPPERLVETIPDFHHTQRRFEALVRAIEQDPANRASGTRNEIDFVLGYEGFVDVLLRQAAAGDLPVRAIHNDTKANNVLIDRETGEGLCVTDLDTTMPGLALYDFGDMVRTAACTTHEDDPRPQRMELDRHRFEALVEGYLSATGDLLTPAETDQLVVAGKLITLEIGIRFLTDYLLGDTYFKTSRPEHNLDRCRTQFALVASIEEQETALYQFVQRRREMG